MTEREIVILARKGEENACRELFERYFSKVFRIALTYTGYNDEEAKDISQKTFIRAFKQLDTLREPEKFGSWINAIARNVALRHIEDKKRRAEVPLLQDRLIDEHLWAINQDDEQARQMEIEVVRQIILSVSNDSIRETVQMYYLEGKLNTEQIAEKQGIPKSTVTSRLDRFRSRYQRIIMRRILKLRGEV